jgi:DNA helicase-2/ATP-dependent DNA helicase PcrA
MKEKILAWVAEQKTPIEQCIVAAAQDFFKKNNPAAAFSTVLYDLKQSQKESLALGRGSDLCYDRYTTGVLYSLFYQGRRINTSLTFAIDFVMEAIEKKQPITVFDLGAGAGAVQIALGLCLQGARELNIPLPKIRIINIDISPFMLEYAQSYLLPAFRAAFPEGFNHLLAEYEAVSWTNHGDLKVSNPFIVASYLFDNSDNREEVAKTFTQIIQRFDPERLVLLTSWRKRHLLEKFAKNLNEGKKYLVRQLQRSFVFSGPMLPVQVYRQEFENLHEPVFGAHHLVKWDPIAFFGYSFVRSEQRFALEDTSDATPNPQLNLYLPPIKVRREVVLSDKQLKAAQPTSRPTIILGSAGSGKSVVITERIKNVIEQHNYGSHLRILLTTFNNELSNYLREWMMSILNTERITRSGGRDEMENFHFDGSKEPNLVILNFDKLPPRLGKIYGEFKEDLNNDIKPRMQTAIAQVCEEWEIEATDHPKVLGWHFLYNEYVRVIYGQLQLEEQTYLTCTRSNRPHAQLMGHNSFKRQLVWNVVKRFLEIMDKGLKGKFNKGDTYHTVRQRFYRKLVKREIEQFSHVFVDEFQDCTNAEFHLFYGLLKDNNELVVAGDYAQAVHLGASVFAPRESEEFAGEVQMRNWSRTQNILSGSYRLPFRITECIRPLSEQINHSRSDVDVNIIDPYRGAPPGARPILVYAVSEAEMARKLARINFHYQVFDFEKIGAKKLHQLTILEKDKGLVKAIDNIHSGIATTDTILRLKGMEKDCIVWSTRVGVNNPGDEDYYVYTILTRTRSILIIAMFDETIPRYREIVKLFPQERLMVWDKETEHYYQESILSLPRTAVTA